MTRILLDTNVSLRLLEKDDPQHGVVRAAVDRCVAPVRHAASALSHGVGEILTLNPADFVGIPGLTVFRASTEE